MQALSGGSLFFDVGVGSVTVFFVLSGFILTYNYAGTTSDKDGKTTPSRAKSTRVFVKKGDKWSLVHANFASDPVPK